MDQDSIHMVAASKVPMLKPGEYELWRMRMEQYILMVDYALWEVIENGNTAPKTTLVEGVEKFNSIKDAKSLLQAIEKRFGGNAATKKTQRNLLKKQYENFTASSLEVLDQTFDRLQKLISQLKTHGETISQEDIYEPEVKGTSSSSTNTQNVAFVSSNSTNSTKGTFNTTYGATTVSTQATTFNSTTIDNLSDVVIYGFKVADGYANNEGKEILEEHWKEVFYEWMRPLGLISPRWIVTYITKRDTLQGSAGLQGTKKTGTGKAQEEVFMDQAEEGPTNFALMAYSSTSSNSEVSTDSNCSSSCLENVKILKEQNEQLLKDLRTSKLNVIAYKIGLESVEARLLVYKKNESVYEEDIKLTVENFENSSKNLNKLLDSQIVDKCKTSLGYNVVPPPYTGNFMPPKPDLSFCGLEEFVNEPIVSEPTVKKHVVETSEAKASADKPKVVRKNNGAPIIADWVSNSEEEDVPQAKIEKKTVKFSFSKIEFVKSKEQVKSSRKTTVKQGNQNRQNTYTARGNQRNWNNMMSQRLGSDFEMTNKACYVCGSFDHL
ncbi:hypothetical protein Tco_1118080 [Tanacetum coccineum]